MTKQQANERAIGMNRRNVLRKTVAAGVGFSGLGVLAGPVAADGSSLPKPEHNKAVATVLSSEPYKTVKRELIRNGYTPKRSDATSTRHTHGKVEETGVRINIPFKPKGHTTGKSELVAFINEENDGAIELAGGAGLLDFTDGIGDNVSLQHYSDESIVGQDDGVVSWRYVDHQDLDQHVEPPKKKSETNTASTSGFHTAGHVPVPGYNYIGTYGLDDICYVVAGGCFGVFLATLADLVPGDEAIVGTACSVAGGACFIIETIKRLTPCSDPRVVTYKRAWWNPIGPSFVGYPVC